MFWGALDISVLEGQTPQYATTQIVSGGPSAAMASGIGVRRCTVVLDRKNYNASGDSATMHFDFLNMTSGVPDDTWTPTDYSTLEGYLSTMFTTLKPFYNSGTRVFTYIWHRVGTGVPKPNAAERVMVLGTPIAGSASPVGTVPQVGCSITFRTAVRRSWGRTYLPMVASAAETDGTWRSLDVDSICTAVHTMVGAAASSDFHLVVVSGPLSSSLNVEQIEVDDNPDIIRRRRWKTSNYRKLLP